MRLFRWKAPVLMTALVGLLLACSGNDNDPGDGPSPTNPAANDRKVMLTHIADNIILPAYANFKTKFDAMTAKSDAFAAKPDKATLTDFRQAWADAYTEWQKVELFDVGPAEGHTLRFFFNIYPANTAGIEEAVQIGTVNLDVPASYPKQGFPALDYLINGLGDTDDAILSKYTTAPDAAKRIAYLKKITGQMGSVFSKVYGEWTGGYRDTFVNATGTDAGSSLSKLVNGYVLHYERYIRSGKIGIPAGAMAGGTAAPEKVESLYKKDLSLTLAKTAHQAAIDFFNGKSAKDGKEGPGFKTYLNALGAKDSRTNTSLVDIVNAQFDVANKQLADLKPNLYDEVKTNTPAVVKVYDEMQKLVRMLKVDMTSAMGITITYTDNDGD
ncbi:imelysin family protein [Larkinella soli]|uniref:imelysin family protein n=1 Tax=Larkinella soli TaxID=1770527 RepID=UPI000FFB95A8|nr:imelysin family protein [Larkinella soli]